MTAPPLPRLAIPAEIAAQADALVALRRDLHAHPELCFEEFRTADIVARRLEEWGLEVHRGVGGTGVVGVLRRGHAARSVGLRADMDALPMEETNTFAHASRHPGRMHGCGHDGHTAMLLGAAQHLAAHGVFDGTIHFVFQPAEEAGGGAEAMMDDGLFTRFPMEAIFGLHNWPGLPAGDIAASPGAVMASSNEFRITLHGKGGHAAMPQDANDPVPVACQLVQAFQTIVSRNTRPLDAAVISVTMIEAGDATNVIPDRCTLQGTVRTFALDVLDLVEERMRLLTEHLAEAFGMTATFEFERNYPPTLNSREEARFVHELATELLGPRHSHRQEPSMAAEDFSFMLLQKPGCYFFLGNGDGQHRSLGHGAGPCMLHSGSYDFNDRLLPQGATFWVRLAERWLARPAPVPYASDGEAVTEAP